MKKELEFQDIIGKTITAVADSSSDDAMIIVFDNSFIVLGCIEGYHLEDKATLSNIVLDRDEFTAEDLLATGIYTKTELEELTQQQELKRQQWTTAKDQVTYERLKKKFEKQDAE